jgi:hypothetical protein
MIQTLPELVTFDEFIDWYPENQNTATNCTMEKLLRYQKQQVNILKWPVLPH